MISLYFFLFPIISVSPSYLNKAILLCVCATPRHATSVSAARRGAHHDSSNHLRSSAEQPQSYSLRRPPLQASPPRTSAEGSRVLLILAYLSKRFPRLSAHPNRGFPCASSLPRTPGWLPTRPLSRAPQPGLPARLSTCAHHIPYPVLPAQPSRRPTAAPLPASGKAFASTTLVPH